LKIVEKTFIAFLDDDDRKKEDWVIIKEFTLSYVSFIYQNKIVTLPWHRILKVKESEDE